MHKKILSLLNLPYDTRLSPIRLELAWVDLGYYIMVRAEGHGIVGQLAIS